jgi:hypothetical protein
VCVGITHTGWRIGRAFGEASQSLMVAGTGFGYCRKSSLPPYTSPEGLDCTVLLATVSDAGQGASTENVHDLCKQRVT